MSRLEKATLQEVERRDQDLVPVGEALAVQFNPETLRLALRNRIEGGNTKARQVRQYTGSASTSLSFDLVFDTADEIRKDGTAPSVRERTAMVERFVLPRSAEDEGDHAPPMVRFHWGKLVLDGIISQLDVDFELFTPDGTPLRAKMRVSIEEQDPRYQALEVGPGSREGGSSSSGSGLPGTVGVSLGGSVQAGFGAGGSLGAGGGAQVGVSLGGESAAEFAARVGVDPGRWRGLGNLPSDPSSLPAGVEIGFGAGLSTSLGGGVRGGVGASAGTGTGGEGAGSAAQEALRGGGGSSGSAREDGLALSAAGGVGAALSDRDRDRADAEAREARRAFDTPGAASAGGGSEAAGAPQAGGASVGTGRESPSARPDPRAQSFGRGVPLRPRVRTAGEARVRQTSGSTPLTPGRREAAVEGRDPGAPSWSRPPTDDEAER